MTPERAEFIVGRIVQFRDAGVALDIPELYAEMVAERGWLAIGYGSWDELMDSRVGGWRLALPRQERREAVAAMASEGMSTRAIASAVGVDHATVVRDQQAGGADAPPAPPPVTGLDGKTYTRPPRPPRPHRRPLPDAFFQTSYDLAKKAKSLCALTTDNRWSRNAEQVARYRNALLRTRDLIDVHGHPGRVSAVAGDAHRGHAAGDVRGGSDRGRAAVTGRPGRARRAASTVVTVVVAAVLWPIWWWDDRLARAGDPWETDE